MNRSMQYNNQLQKSMVVDSRRTSDALLMPRSSIFFNSGFRGKHSNVMHQSIGPSAGKGLKNLAAAGGAGPFGFL